MIQERDVVVAQAGPATILVVDDETIVRTVMGTCLENAGFKVLKARDGVQALEIFTEQTSEIDLVVLDMTMPRLSGEQTFHRLRHIEPELPILFSSGHPDEEGKWARDGLTDFLEKPFPPETLLRKIHENLMVHRAATM